MNGRSVATPSHWFQFSPSGTLSFLSGFAAVSPHDLPLHEWTSFTFPITPSWISFTTSLCLRAEWIWMPIWVTTFFWAATSVSRRAS